MANWVLCVGCRRERALLFGLEPSLAQAGIALARVYTSWVHCGRDLIGSVAPSHGCATNCTQSRIHHSLSSAVARSEGTCVRAQILPFFVDWAAQTRRIWRVELLAGGREKSKLDGVEACKNSEKVIERQHILDNVTLKHEFRSTPRIPTLHTFLRPLRVGRLADAGGGSGSGVREYPSE